MLDLCLIAYWYIKTGCSLNEPIGFDFLCNVTMVVAPGSSQPCTSPPNAPTLTHLDDDKCSSFQCTNFYALFRGPQLLHILAIQVEICIKMFVLLYWAFGIQIHTVINFFCDSRNEDFSLLSCSLDKSMIVWKFDSDSGMWIETVRVGEVGGNTLGFLGCEFRLDANILIGYNFNGSVFMSQFCKFW